MYLSSSQSARLQFQQESLQEIVAGLSETQLRHRVLADKWSIFENIAHLAAYQAVFIGRLERMRKEKDGGAQLTPAFSRYVAGDDPGFPAYLDMSLEELYTDIAVKRAEINSLVRGMSGEDLRLTGLHPKFGRMEILQWTEFFLLHEAHHLYTIFRLSKELRSTV